ncbi:MAG TPA: S41 family peptidase [Pirellulales bacterium]|nr:S41 family peptidase [Pirellulales bacterium]
MKASVRRIGKFSALGRLLGLWMFAAACGAAVAPLVFTTPLARTAHAADGAATDAKPADGKPADPKSEDAKPAEGKSQADPDAPGSLEKSEKKSTPPAGDSAKSSDDQSTDSAKPADDKSSGSAADGAKPGPVTPAEAAARRQLEDQDYEFYKSLADTIDQVERNYVKPIDRRELMEAAIKGVLGKLDPYSSYISPDEINGFRTTVESQFGGIGIQITPDDGQVKVSTPLVGTPAYKAGVLAGDRIIRIEGESIRGMSLDDVVRKLKGEVGTTVSFTVRHALTGKEETFTIQRELIHVDTVMGDSHQSDDTWNYMLDTDQHIGYIRISAFSRDTADDLKRALETLKQQKMRGLVLDLRFNPGGLLTSAIDVCNMFISEGRIVSTKGRNSPERVWDATPATKFEGFPMAVLVNEYSASASEIVSACLQDHDRAVIIGERTWGKGSVQNVIELEDGKSALKLTTATYTRPNGHNIHRFPDSKETDEWGVKPNDGYEVRLSDGEMGALLADRRQRDIVPGHSHEEKPPQTLAAASPEKPSADAHDDAHHDDAHHDEVHHDDAKSSADVTAPGKSEKSAAAQPSSLVPHTSKFTDRQLQKALDYLSTELAHTQ